MPERKKTLKVEKSPLFRVEYTDGVSGGINVNQDIGWLQFHVDNPEVIYDTEGQIIGSGMSRDLIIDLRMSLETFKAISIFMADQIKQRETLLADAKKGKGK